MRRSLVTDHSQISRLFKARAIVAGLFSFLLIAALLTRLGWLQIVEYAHFAGLSKENRVRLMALPPNSMAAMIIPKAPSNPTRVARSMNCYSIIVRWNSLPAISPYYQVS